MKPNTSPKNFAKRFSKDEQGSVLLIFGLCAVFLTAIGGAAVDLGTQQLMRLKLQNSVDLAVTSAGSLISCQVEITPDIRTAAAKRYFALNYPEQFADNTQRPDLIIEKSDNNEIIARAEDDIATHFVNNFSINSLDAKVRSGASVTDRNLNTDFDSVIVVDESGSMAGLAKAPPVYVPPDYSGNTPPTAYPAFKDSRAGAARSAFATFVNNVFPDCIIENKNTRMGFVGFAGFVSNKWAMTNKRAKALQMPGNIFPKGRNIEEIGLRAGRNMVMQRLGFNKEINTWNNTKYQPGWYSDVGETEAHPENRGYDHLYVLDPAIEGANERRGTTHPISTNLPGKRWYPLAGNQGYLGDNSAAPLLSEGFDDLSVDFDTRVPTPALEDARASNPPKLRYMIFMSDGSVATDSSTNDTTAMQYECEQARLTDKIEVFVINFTSKGPDDVTALKACAGSEDHYFFAPDEAGLKTILRNIGATIRKTRIVQ